MKIAVRDGKLSQIYEEEIEAEKITVKEREMVAYPGLSNI